jgi:hypothetical protein
VVSVCFLKISEYPTKTESAHPGKGWGAEVGKVTFKSNGDEVLSDESLKKVTAMKR